MVTKREGTIKYCVPNLRNKWPGELRPYSDNQIAALYEDFSLSDEFGNNDINFPKWFEMLSGYPE